MKIARYAFNPLTRTLAASPAFLKNASRLDSMEYQIIRQLRADYGEITITEEKSNRKAPNMIRFFPSFLS